MNLAIKDWLVDATIVLYWVRTEKEWTHAGPLLPRPVLPRPIPEFTRRVAVVPLLVPVVVFVDPPIWT